MVDTMTGSEMSISSFRFFIVSLSTLGPKTRKTRAVGEYLHLQHPGHHSSAWTVFDGLFSSQHTADKSVQIRRSSLETHATSHATHASHSSHASWHLLLFLGDLCNYGLSGREQWCHSCSIQQCSPHHLGTKKKKSPLIHKSHTCESLKLKKIN